MSTHSALKAGNVAVITGAGAGGIGFAVARLLATRYHLHPVLLDRDPSSLDLAYQQLIAQGVPQDKFDTQVVDVADPEALQQAADSIFQRHGHVDFLHLNAGVGGPSKSYGKDMLGDWERIFRVNLGGVTAGSAAFVERIVAQDTPAIVVITGSKQGMSNPPGTGPAYNASKAAVKTFAEVLAHDLRPTKVSVKLLVPGWVYTKLSTGGKPVDDAAKPEGAWSADQCAEEFFARLNNNGDEFYIICPDKETSSELDYARLAWTADDVLKKRPALSRWHPAYKDEFEQFVAERTGK